MYYNSNKSSNDYYNSYKQEVLQLKADRKKEERQKIIKILLSLLTLMLFIMATFYLYKYFNPLATFENEQRTNIVIREEQLPSSIQLREADSSDSRVNREHKIASTMNEKDIALIVQIIMSQMNAKVEKSLVVELQEIEKKKFVNKNLKSTNHYNKVILNTNEVQEVQNASLVQLSTNLSRIMNEEITSNSHYTQEIKKEIHFRENEMRVIIVQEGDTLSKIAKKAYGNRNDYSKIFSANPEIIKNPNQIFVGQRLRIPS